MMPPGGLRRIDGGLSTYVPCLRRHAHLPEFGELYGPRPQAGRPVLIAASPWLFGFAKSGPRHQWPHALMGATEVLIALMSKARKEHS